MLSKTIDAHRPTYYRWVISSLVCVITLVNFIDRSAISFVIHPLKEEFHFTDTEFGMILSAFGAGYMLLTALGGWLVDRWGARITWSLAAITWSFSVAFLGCASTFLQFIGLRFLLGITEGPHFPAMTRTISDWLPASERARALSLGLVAIPLASVIGAPMISYLVVNFGWRMMFVIISGLGVIWAICWYILFRNKPEDSKYVGKAEALLITSASKEVLHGEKVGWRFVLTHPALVANNIAYFAFGYMLFLVTLWLPGYFISHHKLDLKLVGWYLIIPWLVGALFLKMGGIISDSIYKKSGSSRLARSYLIWITQLLTAVCFVLLALSHSLFFSILFLSLGIGFGLMAQPAFFSVNIDVVKERSGLAQGVTSSSLSLAGIIAPVVTGSLIDFTGSYNIAFLLLAGLMVISSFVVIMFHHPDTNIIDLDN